MRMKKGVKLEGTKKIKLYSGSDDDEICKKHFLWMCAIVALDSESKWS